MLPRNLTPAVNSGDVLHRFFRPPGARRLPVRFTRGLADDWSTIGPTATRAIAHSWQGDRRHRSRNAHSFRENQASSPTSET